MSDSIRVLLLVGAAAVSAKAWAGPVNSSESFPAAQMNVAGDSVWAGDQRIMAHWKGSYVDRRYAVAPFHFEKSSEHAFSVGIAEPLAAVGEAVAIACSRNRAAIYIPERKDVSPNGMWREVKALGGISFENDAISCAMRPDGSYAIHLLRRGVLVTSTGQVLPLGGLGAFSRLVAADKMYAVFGANGKVVLAWPGAEGLRLTRMQTSPFGVPSELTRFVGNARGVLKADADAIRMSEFSLLAGEPLLGDARRLPVSPCEENQACGVSLATDGTWAVSGYWGTFLGFGNRFVRLSFPNLSRSSGGIAFAHSGRSGSYVYIGNDDGDMGLLPETVAFDSGVRQEPEEGRYAVWHRPGFWTRSGRGMRLFPWKINRKINGHIEQFYENEVSIHTGPLPNPIPRSWVAWEAQEKVSAPRLPSTAKRALSERSFESAWWLRSVSAREALAVAGNAPLRPVVVSVVDSGAQMDHPWLREALLQNAFEVPGNGRDDDGNGFVDDVSGYDFVDDDAIPQDEFGHGTHVAGLIAARDPSTHQPVGTNVATTLRVIRALDARGQSNSIDLARSISYAVSEGTDIMNCSWGGGPATQVLRDAFAFAVENNVMVISSAGNDRLNSDMYPQVPKMFPGVTSVAAHSETGNLASFSNWGATTVAWVAPGDNILSTLMGGVLGTMSGTSMAAPIATNIASFVYGLASARYPELRRDELRRLTERALCETASLQGLNGKAKCGRIDAAAAVQWILEK